MAKSGYISITQDKQSVVNNTSNITVDGYVTTTGESYRGDHRSGTYTIKQGSKTIKNGTFKKGAPANTKTLLFSVSLTISHNLDGTSGDITASYNYDNGWATGSGSKKITTIPRQATITSAPNFNDEQNPTITYSNPAGNAATSLMACISLDATKDDIAYRDINKAGTSYTFKLTEEEREVLRKACTTSKNREVIFYVRTKIGDKTFYSTLKKTLTIVNAEPLLEASVEDSNSSTLALTGSKDVFVKYKSNALYSMTASGLKGATIKTYSVLCGSNSSSNKSGTLHGVESNVFVFKVTDSRGYTTTLELKKGLVNYVPLTCVFKPGTPTADGQMDFYIDGNCFKGSFGAFQNQVFIQYRYKTEGDSDYSAWQDISEIEFNNNQYHASGMVNDLNYRLKYIFQARIIDSLMNVDSNEYPISVVPVFYWGKNGFFLNVPLSILDAVQDYLVESGTDGIWQYKKWASGECELHCCHETNVSVAVARGSVYRTELQELQLPFKVYGPRVFIDCSDINVWASSGTLSKESIEAVSYCLWRGDSYVAHDYNTDILIKGKWKSEEV